MRHAATTPCLTGTCQADISGYASDERRVFVVEQGQVSFHICFSLEVTMTRTALRSRAVPARSLGGLLGQYRTRLAKSQAAIARDAWLDESYVSRLFSGERTNPSRDAIILLCAFGLELPVEDVDEVLMMADYKPLVLPQTLR